MTGFKTAHTNKWRAPMRTWRGVGYAERGLAARVRHNKIQLDDRWLAEGKYKVRIYCNWLRVLAIGLAGKRFFPSLDDA